MLLCSYACIKNIFHYQWSLQISLNSEEMDIDLTIDDLHMALALAMDEVEVFSMLQVILAYLSKELLQIHDQPPVLKKKIIIHKKSCKKIFNF